MSFPCWWIRFSLIARSFVDWKHWLIDVRNLPMQVSFKLGGVAQCLRAGSTWDWQSDQSGSSYWRISWSTFPTVSSPSSLPDCSHVSQPSFKITCNPLHWSNLSCRTSSHLRVAERANIAWRWSGEIPLRLCDSYSRTNQLPSLHSIADSQSSEGWLQSETRSIQRIYQPNFSHCNHFQARKPSHLQWHSQRH